MYKMRLSIVIIDARVCRSGQFAWKNVSHKKCALQNVSFDAKSQHETKDGQGVPAFRNGKFLANS